MKAAIRTLSAAALSRDYWYCDSHDTVDRLPQYACWLSRIYSLTLSEAAQVLGVAVQYQVANLAGRSVGVAAKLDKAVLKNLSPPAATKSKDMEPSKNR